MGFCPRMKNAGEGKTAGCTFLDVFVKTPTSTCQWWSTHVWFPPPRIGGEDFSRSLLPYISRILKATGKKVLFLGDTEPVVNCIIQHSDFTNENQHNQHSDGVSWILNFLAFLGLLRPITVLSTFFFLCGLIFYIMLIIQGAPRNNSKHACTRVIQLLKC